MDYALLGGAHAERGRKLFLTGLALLIGAVLYLIYTANVDEVIHLWLGISIFILAVIPCLLWARAGGSRFPVFETILVLCANAYAMPLLNAREQLAVYSAEVITRAGVAVVLYQLSAIVIYLLTQGVPGRARFWRESIITHGIERFMVYGLILSTTYIGISTFTDWVPGEVESILRATFYGVGILCTFISTQRWGRGEMTQGDKAMLLCTLIPQLIFMSVGLLLIGAIGLIGIGLLGYIAGGKRIPWLAIGVLFGVMAILHTGKTRMRMKYWDVPTFPGNRSPHWHIQPILVAGTPAISAYGGTSRVITAPAPIKQYSPSVDPQTIVALAPIDAPRRTSVRRYSFRRDTWLRGFITFVNTIDGPQNTSRSSSTPS